MCSYSLTCPTLCDLKSLIFICIFTTTTTMRCKINIGYKFARRIYNEKKLSLLLSRHHKLEINWWTSTRKKTSFKIYEVFVTSFSSSSFSVCNLLAFINVIVIQFECHGARNINFHSTWMAIFWNCNFILSLSHSFYFRHYSEKIKSNNKSIDHSGSWENEKIVYNQYQGEIESKHSFTRNSECKTPRKIIQRVIWYSIVVHQRKFKRWL